MLIILQLNRFREKIIHEISTALSNFKAVDIAGLQLVSSEHEIVGQKKRDDKMKDALSETMSSLCQKMTYTVQITTILSVSHTFNILIN